MRGARPLLTELRGYADMTHCNCAGSRFISFSIVGRAIDTDVEFAIWKRKLTTWRESSKENLTLTIIDEVTVSTMMHALSNVLVGGEAGGDDGFSGSDNDARLREVASVGTWVFSVN